MFHHTNTIIPYDIRSTDTNHGRFYTTPQGNVYPSITTILGDGDKTWLKEWREGMGQERADAEAQRAAIRGTAVHSMIEKHLNNDPAPTLGHAPEHIPGFLMLRSILKRVNNIITQESALWSDTLRVAGRVDCIGEYQGKLAVIDFKTSTNDKSQHQIGDYFLQTTAYALMFQELYNVQIDEVVIIMSVEKGAVPLVFKQDISPHIEPLIRRINTYHTKHRIAQ